MARHLFEHSYDVSTLNGTAVIFADGCHGVIRNEDGQAVIRQLGDRPAHTHEFRTSWSIAAWEYIDKGRPFPTHQSVCARCDRRGILMDLDGHPRDTCQACSVGLPIA